MDVLRTVRAVAVITVVTVGGLVAGCGSSSSSVPGASPAAPAGSAGKSPGGSSAGFGSPGPTSSSSPGLAACRTSGLRISLDSGKADAAAGSTYYPLDFTNVSPASCVLTGYPGVSFVSATDEGGRQIGAAAARNPQFGPVMVTLARGGEAHAWLQVAAAGNYPENTCQPTTAHGLRVYPPGETEAGYPRQDFPACAGEGARLLTIMPVRGGAATRGSVP